RRALVSDRPHVPAACRRYSARRCRSRAGARRLARERHRQGARDGGVARRGLRSAAALAVMSAFRRTRLARRGLRLGRTLRGSATKAEPSVLRPWGGRTLHAVTTYVNLRR